MHTWSLSSEWIVLRNPARALVWKDRLLPERSWGCCPSGLSCCPSGLTAWLRGVIRPGKESFLPSLLTLGTEKSFSSWMAVGLGETTGAHLAFHPQLGERDISTCLWLEHRAGDRHESGSWTETLRPLEGDLDPRRGPCRCPGKDGFFRNTRIWLLFNRRSEAKRRARRQKWGCGKALGSLPSLWLCSLSLFLSPSSSAMR